jgi:hypothetical protein
MVYITAASALAWPLPAPVWIGASAIGAYIVILSLIARHEVGNPARLRLVVFLLCGISLLDSLILAFCQQWTALFVALICFVLTIAAQRRVKGT